MCGEEKLSKKDKNEDWLRATKGMEGTGKGTENGIQCHLDNQAIPTLFGCFFFFFTGV